jgi:hypothetical protein
MLVLSTIGSADVRSSFKQVRWRAAMSRYACIIVRCWRSARIADPKPRAVKHHEYGNGMYAYSKAALLRCSISHHCEQGGEVDWSPEESRETADVRPP